MLSCWFNIFSKEKGGSVVNGPVSFYKFKQGDNVIVLIGECHGNIPAGLERQYHSLFYKFAIENGNVKFLIEKESDGSYEKSDTDIGFIECILNLAETGDVNVIKADKRRLPEGLEGFYSFLHDLSKFILTWKEECIKKHLKLEKMNSVIKSIINDERILQNLYTLSESRPKFTLLDWYKFIESEAKYLDELITRYSNVNEKLKEFLVSCLLSISKILITTDDLINDYCAMGFDQQKALTKSLSDICVDMITKNGGETLFLSNELIKYFANHLDATLACDIWDALKSDNDLKKTIVVITGAKHTERLSSLFGAIAETLASHLDDNKLISPEIMQKFLRTDFQYALTKRKW